MTKQTTKRICLWSGPRNISTALMYAFAQRSDTRVYDEPLYAHYLSSTPAREYHPGSEEILATMENDGEKVIAQMLAPQEQAVVFYKHMTHHLIELDWSFLKDTINVILTRDPVDMLPSYAKNVAQPAMYDVGYAMHIELLDYLKKIGQDPVVLDSRKVLDDPRRVLSMLCEKIGIPFEENMLHWSAGAREEDGCWAPYWYASVHQSTGFQAYRPKTAPFPEQLQSLLAECQPLYQQLSELALC